MKIDDWLRAERLAHDVIFDMNNYAQGETLTLTLTLGAVLCCTVLCGAVLYCAVL